MDWRVLARPRSTTAVRRVAGVEDVNVSGAAGTMTVRQCGARRYRRPGDAEGRGASATGFTPLDDLRRNGSRSERARCWRPRQVAGGPAPGSRPSDNPSGRHEAVVPFQGALAMVANGKGQAHARLRRCPCRSLCHRPGSFPYRALDFHPRHGSSAWCRSRDARSWQHCPARFFDRDADDHCGTGAVFIGAGEERPWSVLLFLIGNCSRVLPGPRHGRAYRR